MKIAELNDRFRQTMMGGKVLITPGVRDVFQGVNLSRLMMKISEQTHFDEDTPEHDFGVVQQNGRKAFWKIDYYDDTMEYGSPDPSDPTVTTRVMTVMLPSEY